MKFSFDADLWAFLVFCFLVCCLITFGCVSCDGQKAGLKSECIRAGGSVISRGEGFNCVMRGTEETR